MAREHTGILEADERLRVETGFIKGEARWAPNLISATPTLEMGIDIGDLSTLLLSSVPPGGGELRPADGAGAGGGTGTR